MMRFKSSIIRTILLFAALWLAPLLALSPVNAAPEKADEYEKEIDDFWRAHPPTEKKRILMDALLSTPPRYADVGKIIRGERGLFLDAELFIPDSFFKLAKEKFSDYMNDVRALIEKEILPRFGLKELDIGKSVARSLDDFLLSYQTSRERRLTPQEAQIAAQNEMRTKYPSLISLQSLSYEQQQELTRLQLKYEETTVLEKVRTPKKLPPPEALKAWALMETERLIRLRRSFGDAFIQIYSENFLEIEKNFLEGKDYLKLMEELSQKIFKLKYQNNQSHKAYCALVLFFLEVSVIERLVVALASHRVEKNTLSEYRSALVLPDYFKFETWVRNFVYLSNGGFISLQVIAIGWIKALSHGQIDYWERRDTEAARAGRPSILDAITKIDSDRNGGVGWRERVDQINTVFSNIVGNFRKRSLDHQTIFDLEKIGDVSGSRGFFVCEESMAKSVAVSSDLTAKLKSETGIRLKSRIGINVGFGNYFSLPTPFHFQLTGLKISEYGGAEKEIKDAYTVYRTRGSEGYVVQLDEYVEAVSVEAFLNPQKMGIMLKIRRWR